VVHGRDRFIPIWWAAREEGTPEKHITLITNNYFSGIQVAESRMKASGGYKLHVFTFLLWYVFGRGDHALFLRRVRAVIALGNGCRGPMLG
jgi:hypothetical protein